MRAARDQDEEASAAWGFISQRGSGLAAPLRTSSACSARPWHSWSSDKCIHRGTAVAVSATPIDASLRGENAQSSAARRELCVLHVGSGAGSADMGEKRRMNATKAASCPIRSARVSRSLNRIEPPRKIG
jgi:hypothetical protein